MDLSLILRGYIPFVISLTFHEAAHALAARLGGDNTAYLGGQVTLNPVPHMRREPFGTIVLPLLLLISTGGRQVMGWASAPIDPLWAMRHPRRAAVVSFAGPLANLLLAVVAFAVLKYALRSGVDHREGTWLAIKQISAMFLELNLLLCVFNLLPVPPLDGAGVLEGIFPRLLGPVFAAIRSQPFVMLALFFVLIQYGGSLYGPIIELVRGWL